MELIDYLGPISHALVPFKGLLTAVAVWALISLFSRHLARRNAETTHADARTLYSTAHEYRTCHPSEFPSADVAYYDRVERELGTLGFRKIGDHEDMTVSRVYPQMRTFVRALVSADGTTVASIYHIRMRGWMRVLSLFRIIPTHIRTTDFESELVAGTLVCTANSQGGDLSSDVPGIHRQSLPVHLGPAEVWAQHRRCMAELVTSHGPPKTMLRTEADCLALQHRIQAAKNRSKADMGYVDLAQFDRCAKSAPGSGDADAMRAHLERLKREDLQSPNPAVVSRVT
jgi:hypothetical protein